MIPEQVMSSRIRAENGTVLPFRLYIPEHAPGTRLPLLVYTHGMGSVGTDNLKQIQSAGNVQNILNYTEMRSFPFILLAPQTPIPWVDADWTKPELTMKKTPTPYFAALLRLIENAPNTWNADPFRIYSTGCSMGGFCAWELLQRRSDLFAAALIVCGAGDTSLADKLVNVPVWCTHGSMDDCVPVECSRRMFHAVNAAGGDVILTEFPRVKHDAWVNTYSDSAYLDWLFSRRKKPENKK